MKELAHSYEMSAAFKMARDILEKGYFDKHYYKNKYPDIGDDDPLIHFFLHGCKEGRWPNVIFDPIWYWAQHPAVQSSGFNPLLHYAVQGEREGLNPSPLFDVKWYRNYYKLNNTTSPLLHYLANRFNGFSPIPEFDAEFYLKTYKDVAEKRIDPFLHYMSCGFKESRKPSQDFNPGLYKRRFLNDDKNANPLVHLLQNKHQPGFLESLAQELHTPYTSVKKFSRPGPQFAEFSPPRRAGAARAKLLAFYLTQYHSIPENDQWWGTGFTEWTNIARGQPRFAGHYQPRIPRDLGFYDLSDIAVMRKQAHMAQSAGVHGFVFYYYHFSGKRLLEKPLEQFLTTPDIEMPFCLMWANENWTRRWDGAEQEILIAQQHSASDEGGFCADIARHFRDRRYIRINNRPVLFVYRPEIIKNAVSTFESWRKRFRQTYDEDPILVMAQCFDAHDPGAFGLDGAIEFPPHKLTREMPPINEMLEVFDETFEGYVFSYEQVVAKSVCEAAPRFPLIKTATPSWDNDARRQGSGLIIHGSTPDKYERWLAALVERAQKNTFFGEAIVAVNAWNEWCEGAYLEPDVHYGSAYLNATARAVFGQPKKKIKSLLLVGHDAFPAGAQQLLLHIGRSLKSLFGFDIEFVLLGEGAMEAAYRAVAPLTVVSRLDRLRDLLADKATDFAAAIVNSSASGLAAPILKEFGLRSVMLVHEMPKLLEEKNLIEAARAGAKEADVVVFPADCVKQSFLERVALSANDKMIVRPQGSYKVLARNVEKANALRAELGLSAGAPLVLGAGYADSRKGFDLFLKAWRLCKGRNPAIHFCWIGDIDPFIADRLQAEIIAAKNTGAFHMPGFVAEPGIYFSAADVFALTSREDPFPTVVLEALSVGVPVVAFEGSGGIPEFLTRESLGCVVPSGDLPAMADAIMKMPPAKANRPFVEKARRLVEEKFSFEAYARDLFRLAAPDAPKISVIVPNYNYGHRIEERLRSIFEQDCPIWEIIVLDDASTDDSIAVINRVANDLDRDITLVINDGNAGTVFKQWQFGAEMATGDFVWIAEADDLSKPKFLRRLVDSMKDDARIAMSFCDSRSIDAEDKPVYQSYKAYYSTVEPNALAEDQEFDGREFIDRYLTVKNLILNVSSVVWRKQHLLDALKNCESDLGRWRLAGDWRVYVECLSARGARISYVAEPLNIHRRHSGSVTSSIDAGKHIAEIEAMHGIAGRYAGDLTGAVRKQYEYIDQLRRELRG